ncbi:helicase [Gregarina niphandrodes]|uniref:Helicase n=1 Tax=Gregarina niphandrodes TaxID=110365 RepID=A0A023B912_GRENI|nr:helicase [Gregarina niphandrodes]EZG70696.1 helicase [Gregarina niphandrodes]|eukprot:XP_011129879.1 helicase [Gregarina niphandrodes]
MPEKADTWQAQEALEAEEKAKYSEYTYAPVKLKLGKEMRTSVEWSTLGLCKPLLRALRDMEYAHPTPVQKDAIPLALAGKDVLGMAQTGSGKTGAFLLPCIERLSRSNLIRGRRLLADGRIVGNKHSMTKVLVMLPTRELAAQCHGVCRQFCKYLPVTSCLLCGGASVDGQEWQMRSCPDIVVATPGRCLDLLLNSAGVHLDLLDIVVFDEADKLIDLGFKHVCLEIMKRLNKNHQTLLFSATLNSQAEELSTMGQTNPVRVPKNMTSLRATQAARIRNEFYSFSMTTGNAAAGRPMAITEDITTGEDATGEDATGDVAMETATTTAMPKTKGVIDLDDLEESPKSKVSAQKRVKSGALKAGVLKTGVLKTGVLRSKSDAKGAGNPAGVNAWLVRLSLLAKVLDEEVNVKGLRRILVFFNSKVNARKASVMMKELSCMPAFNEMHSDLEHWERVRTLKQFQDGEITVLFCTDLLARGIDLDNLELVINAETPETDVKYLHRIGRTGRGGSKGRAITIYDHERERSALKAIFKSVKCKTAEKFTKVEHHNLTTLESYISLLIKKRPAVQKQLKLDKLQKEMKVLEAKTKKAAHQLDLDVQNNKDVRNADVKRKRVWIHEEKINTLKKIRSKVQNVRPITETTKKLKSKPGRAIIKPSKTIKKGGKQRRS